MKLEDMNSKFDQIYSKIDAVLKDNQNTRQIIQQEMD